QAARREPAFRQDFQDLFREHSVAELHRRHVDRELEVSRPASRIFQRLFQNAECQRTDKACPLSRFDEAVSLQQDAARRTPAGERLEADDLPAVEVNERLEEGHELAGLDSAANFLFELQSIADLALKLFVKPRKAVSAG